jgi:dihydrofolate reductase
MAGASLSIIVAIAENGVIGKEGGLPWRLRSDLRRFRTLTMGHPLIMGRKTFESIGKPLDGRDCIVLTRRPSEDPAAKGNVFFVSSLRDAIAAGDKCAAARGVAEIFAIGGADLFEQVFPVAKRIYLTRVHGTPEGNICWEPCLGDGWIDISRQDRPESPNDNYPVTDFVFERRKPA